MGAKKIEFAPDRAAGSSDNLERLDSRTSVVMDYVFKGEMTVDRLQMIREAVFGAAEIEPLIFYAGPEIPFAGDEKAMVIAEIVVERLAITELRLVKIAIEGVCRF